MVLTIIPRSGKRIALNRIFKNTPDYTAPSNFRIGQNQSIPNQFTEQLDSNIPFTNLVELDTVEDSGSWSATNCTVEDEDGTVFIGVLSMTILKTAGNTNFTISKTINNTPSSSGKQIAFILFFLNNGYNILANAGTALRLRFGTNASNYYQFTLEKSELNIGLNQIIFTIDNGDVTGSPGTTNLDYFELTLIAESSGSTTSAGEIIFDDVRLYDLVSSYIKPLSSTGYPVIDEANLETTNRGYLNSGEGNSFLITGYAQFNTDTTPLLFSVSQLSLPQTKTQFVEYQFIEVDRIL